MMHFFWSFCAFLIRQILKLRYRVEVRGLKELRAQLRGKKESVLFLPNHVSEVEPLMLGCLLWKDFKVRAMITSAMYEQGLVNFLARLSRSLSIPNFELGSNSYKKKLWEKILHEVASSLEKGDNFLIYPAGRLKRGPKEDLKGASGIYQILNEATHTKIVLVRIIGFWGSMFSCALTGDTPPLGKTVKRGFWMILKNLIFFAPRRKITIEFELHDAAEFRNLTHIELNATLAAWYNKPFADNEGKEPLSLVSYTFWKKTIPDASEIAQETTYDITNIDQKVTDKVIEYIANTSNKPQQEVTPEKELGNDLGFDSLELASLITFLEQHFSARNIAPAELTTVGAAIYFAAGLKEHVDWIETPTTLLMRWKWLIKKKNKVGILESRDLLEAFLKRAYQTPHHVACVDEARSSLLTYRKFLIGAIVIAEKIKKYPGEKVGILLPASSAAYVTVIACYLAGKVPVMLNWTQGRLHLEHAERMMKMEAIFTSKAFLDVVANADFGNIDQEFVFLEDVKKKISLVDKLRAARLSKKKPEAILAKYKHQSDPKALATVLFTSGTEGPPKAVGLTHENILVNQTAGLKRVDLHKGDVLYSILPPFHSFGFSVTGLMPILSGVPSVFSPNPLDSANLATGIGKWGITILCGAPSFLQPILQVAKPEEIKSLRLAVSGAEAPSEILINRIKELKLNFAEGYGITECSPIVTIQKPGEERKGVGKVIDNVTVKIVAEETYEPLPSGKEGLIMIQGASVFNGYLSKADDPFVEIEGSRWYNSKDIGYLDEEGNLVLTDRKKRIVKIGGEMVSLGFLEQSLTNYARKKDWGALEGAPTFAVIPLGEDGKPKLIAFTSIKVTLDQLNKGIRELGFSNLIKISDVKHVDFIPLSGTGKVDYRTLQDKLK